jgi:hypothetical protein
MKAKLYTNCKWSDRLLQIFVILFLLVGVLPTKPIIAQSSMEDIYASVKIENMRLDKSVYYSGELVQFDYDFVNRSSNILVIPVNYDYSQPHCLIGIDQKWIERLGDDKTIPPLEGMGRKGSWYAAGGSIINVGSCEMLPDGSVASWIGRHVNTTDFPLGDYRLYAEYKKLFGDVIQTATDVIQTATIDFTVVQGPKLTYVGPYYLPSNAVMIEETDDRITMGDHVHLRLPFRNTGDLPLSDTNIKVTGGQQTGSSIGVSIYDGSSWGNYQQIISLTPSTINPGETGIADFWIYVTDNEPDFRQSLHGQTWIHVSTDDGKWYIPISLSPISFSISGNEDLKSGSCLHSPDNFEIQKYAQYAAAAWTNATPPTNDGDPDTPEQVTRNLVNRVYQEFTYASEDHSRYDDNRLEDTVLLSRRHDVIGVCRHYADLTTGLLRALGLPSRYTDAIFAKNRPFWFDKTVGHAWTETYIGDGGWRQVDSTWNKALEENVYENVGYVVKEVWADKYPLSSSTSWTRKQYQCIAPCYTSPIDCFTCNRESNTPTILWPWQQPDLSCVEDVTSRYHSSALVRYAAASQQQLAINIQAPTFVTRTVPFTLTSSFVNSSTHPLSMITATVPISAYANSTKPLFEVSPHYRTMTDIAPGQLLTLTWVVTPLVTGKGIPLRIIAGNDELFAMNEQPMVVNEPGSLPNLSLEGVCSLKAVSPGQIISLTTYVLDENLRPLSDGTAIVTATVYATPTKGFSAIVSLPYCEECGMYQNVMTLPDTVPIGNYQVDFTAVRSGYDQDNKTSFFFVTPSLSLTLTTSQDVLDIQDVLTLTAQVFERDTLITSASVWAEIGTPAGVTTVPLVIDSGSLYTLTLRPTDMAANLNDKVPSGNWNIQVIADYQGSNARVQKSVIVRHSIYLPLILRSF